jgi:hypothetical protein
MVRVPVRPASDGNRFWKVMRIVGTSRTHTVPAAPKVNVSGSVVVDVVDEDAGSVEEVDGVVVVDVDVDGGDEVVVVGATDEDVVDGSVVVVVVGATTVLMTTVVVVCGIVVDVVVSCVVVVGATVVVV